MKSSELKRRRRRRLGVIAAVILTLAGLVGVRYLMVRGDGTPPVDERRVAGLAAYAGGDFAQALATLKPYVEDNDRDAEALYALANARRRLVQTDGTHLVEAVSYYRQLLKVEPTNLPATAELLSIFMQYPEGVEGEALKLADRLLKAKPNDTTAMRSRAVCLARVGRPDEALAAAEAYLAVVPTDVQVQRIALDLMKQRSLPPATLLARTAALRETHPNDPRFELVEAYAHLLASDVDGAQPWLEKAAQRPPTDRDFILQLVQLMDAAGRFPQVLAYLETAVGPQSDPVLVWELARRRFEAGLLEEAHAGVQQFAGDQRTVAMRTLDIIALHRLGRTDDAKAAHADLIAQGGAQALAAAELLRLSLLEPAPPQRVLDSARNAEAVGLSDPYLDALVAQAFASVGQTEQAITRYESALRQRPSWAGPCLGLAQLLIERGESARATAYAVAATQRQPESINGYILTAVAAGSDPRSLDDGKTDDLLALIERVQKAQPGEPRTLVLRVGVLAERGRKDEAVAAARAAAELDPPLAADALVQLTDTARRYDLGLDGQLQQLYVDRYGQTPQIAMVRALAVAEGGTPAASDAAIAAYDGAMPTNPGAEWAINRAILLERLGHPDATAAWAGVADDFAQNEQVQRRVLRSGSAWQDRPLIARTIERLRDLAGEDDPVWRTEQARLLLTGDDGVDKAAEADALLDAALAKSPDDPDALTLRATSRRLLGKPRESVALLERALVQTPDDATARLELASLQLNLGNRNGALDSARRVLAQSNLSPDQSRGAANLLMRLDQRGQAASVLEGMVTSDTAEPRDRLALAELYRQDNRLDAALAMLAGALEDPTPRAIAFAADLYARAGRPDDAQATLNLLDRDDISTSDAAAVRAGFAASHGSAAEAEAAFNAAIDLDPADAEAWRNLVGYLLRSNQAERAVTLAKESARTVESDAGLAAISTHGDTIKQLSDDEGMAWLWLAMLEEPEHRDAAVAAMNTIAESRRLGRPFAQLADTLAEQSDANPSFEGLAILTVKALLGANRPADATRRAAAAMSRFANSPRSAQLAAETWAVASRWSEALIAAEAWADRTPGVADDRIAAHLLAAMAHRQLGRPEAAVAALEPHHDRVTRQPKSNPRLTREYALALAAARKPSQARAILEPLLPLEGYWRMAWLDAALQGVSDTAEARSWLEAVAAVMPRDGADATDELTALAQAYWAVGVRDGQPALMDQAKAQAQALTARDDADADLFFFIGTMAEATGDLDAAESAYRQTLALDPTASSAMNNLAMILADKTGGIGEAKILAQKAVAAQPLEPNFQDTLAHVLTKARDFDGAEAAIRKAIELDPGNPDWQRRLIDIQSQRQANAG